jgi:hypothetical protein
VEKYTEVFVGLDVAKARHAVAAAEEGRQGGARYIGEIGADADSIRRLVQSWRSVTGDCIIATKRVRPAMGCLASSSHSVINARSSRRHSSRASQATG